MTAYRRTVIAGLHQVRLEATIRELREAGLSYPSIRIVLAKYEGVELTDNQVRAWLRELGLPRDGRKARGVLRDTEAVT